MRKHSFVAKAGLILPLLVLCVCAFGFLLAPNDPDLVDLTKKFLSPCSEFPLGTDNLGRCVLSRLLYGGRTTLGIVLVGSVTVSVLGTLAGLLMGGGKNGKNLILEGVLNAVTAIPPIAYLIIFIAAWGNSVFTMVVAVSASLLLRVIKLVQTRTGIEQGKAYVMCAVASGARPRRILFVHILPNLVWDVLHFICLSCADMTLSIVSFSFIGLGMSPFSFSVSLLWPREFRSAISVSMTVRPLFSYQIRGSIGCLLGGMSACSPCSVPALDSGTILSRSQRMVASLPKVMSAWSNTSTL